MIVRDRFVIAGPPGILLAKEGVSAYPLFLIDLSTEKALTCANNQFVNK
jgi:hypothetical protein